MNPDRVRERIAEIKSTCAQAPPMKLMEVCGTHTVALLRGGIRSILPETIRLISGPGCPVCVTPQGYIDAAGDLARRDKITICTYGDMIRVPGGSGSLADRRAEGADIRIVYSAMGALKFAQANPDRTVVFLAIGFETTAPATALLIKQTAALGVENLLVLNAHKRVLPAMRALLQDPDVPIDGFICPGHVSIVIGSDAYRPLAEEFGKPCVVIGFEPVQILDGLAELVRLVSENRPEVRNAYPSVVDAKGNSQAQAVIDDVFEPGDSTWRAMGTIPESGLVLREPYRHFDAADRFDLDVSTDDHLSGCRCGEVLQGKIDPPECGLFGRQCNPMHPIGPCMVSSEGSCSAWFKYRQSRDRGSRPDNEAPRK